MPPVYPHTSNNLPEPLRKIRPELVFVALIICALVAFELFNYTTTDHALADLLGDLTFVGIPWSTILALAFCGIDFAGIARLFTPEQGTDEPKEVWYLFGAWLLAATMNAILTWWGVSMAVINHQVQSTSLIDPQTLTNVVPVFVAVMVWVIRILIIGTLSLSMDRLLHPAHPLVRDQRSSFERSSSERSPLERSMPAARPVQEPRQQPMRTSEPTYPYPSSLGNNSQNQRPPASRAASSGHSAPSHRPSRVTQPPAQDDEDLFGDNTSSRSINEPSYHSLSGMSAKSSNPGGKKLN